MVRRQSRDATAAAGLTRPYYACGSARSPGHFPATNLSSKTSARRISGGRANNSVPRRVKAAAIGTFEVLRVLIENPRDGGRGKKCFSRGLVSRKWVGEPQNRGATRVAVRTGR